MPLQFCSKDAYWDKSCTFIWFFCQTFKVTVWAQLFYRGGEWAGCYICGWKIIPERRDADEEKASKSNSWQKQCHWEESLLQPGESWPHPPSPATPDDSGSIHSAPHETRPSCTLSCQQPASVESESNHLMLNLISLISPCLQPLYPELKVHASCLLWVLWVIHKSLGTAREGWGWWSLCPGEGLQHKGIFWRALSPAGITQFKHSVLGLSATHTVENHSGKPEMHSVLRFPYSIKQY